MAQKLSNLWAFVPRVALIGLAGLVVLAFLPVPETYVSAGAIGIVAMVLLYGTREMARARESLRQELLPEVLANVEPEGPSFQGVLRALPDPVMVISGYEPNDLAGRWVVFANEAAMELFGLRSEGGLLVSSVRNPEVLEIVDEALFGNIERAISYESSGASQVSYWRAFAAPLHNEDDTKRLALLVMRDETDARRMERMRADFLANASHELRSPLASLIGFIETLRGHAKEDPVMRDKFLGIMSAQADRMGRLISDLLSLSRIEMNEHVPPTGEADISMAVKDVIEGLSLMAREKGVAFDYSGPGPGLYPLKADRDQVLQVIQNLTDNALKYAPAGSSVRVEIVINQTIEQATAGREVNASRLVLLRPDRDRHEFYTVVRIRDEGPGIKREYLPRLAERFYRVEGQKSGDRLGTGLGLAIVKHIINRHRGGLAVESQGAVTPQTGMGRDIERSDYETDKVTSLPAPAPATFTAFSVFFPQMRAYNLSEDGPQLASGPDLTTLLEASQNVSAIKNAG
jgi:two-component system, OmpR family, phosphate regulon sensor histidine kinase PhoR